MLGGFGFKFFSGADHGQPGDMDKDRIIATKIGAQLAQRFNEGQTFNITNSTAHFHQHDLSTGGLGHQVDTAFDLVGDVWDHLNGAAQKVAAAFGRNDLSVNLARGDVADAVEADINKTFVMPQIQVGFGAVIQHKDLAVLVRAHGAGIHINIRVQLLYSHFEAAFF
ncbi:hypothetical protein SDC9_184407 [bioreactor metagenome]|uniref:Uncharacterized protein n=1 Tax=bioreactor metagenome TaxID=1076179 RepID=A0A645HCY1_9ZZZZ